MKARIINNVEFGGLFEDWWLENNQDIVFDGQLVSNYVLTDTLPNSELHLKLWDGTSWVEGMSVEDLQSIQNSKIALHVHYPELKSQNHRYVMLDKLPSIKRRESFSNKGLKGKYEYEFDGQLIWSIETKHWFEADTDFPDGLKKIVKLYNVGGDVVDEWVSYFHLTADGKQNILKQQRELILSYFKGRQPDLFNLLYAFFATEINTYVATGDKQSFENTLVTASTDHTVELVRNTLNYVITSESNTQITVLQGILLELV